MKTTKADIQILAIFGLRLAFSAYGAISGPRIVDSPLPEQPPSAECQCGPDCGCCEDDDFKRRKRK